LSFVDLSELTLLEEELSRRVAEVLATACALKTTVAVDFAELPVAALYPEADARDAVLLSAIVVDSRLRLLALEEPSTDPERIVVLDDVTVWLAAERGVIGWTELLAMTLESDDGDTVLLLSTVVVRLRLKLLEAAELASDEDGRDPLDVETAWLDTEMPDPVLTTYVCAEDMAFADSTGLDALALSEDVNLETEALADIVLDAVDDDIVGTLLRGTDCVVERTDVELSALSPDGLEGAVLEEANSGLELVVITTE